MVPKEISSFYNGEGQLKAWPAKRSRKKMAVEWLADFFEDGREYSEKEVNELLDRHHTFGDAALLRRELFENKFLDRTADGSRYWKTASK